ncbi:hypothetical protein [Rhodococcoides yunnanense]|uniref:hypothetical protein n=1 Tax=Rhodococcoides yunnanense TaxID=278209 RepID=UPI0009353961|nr:hypothetical protein [Rhodococcus yunnanensis]
MREANKKKIHRLWTEEGLQVRIHHPRKRASSFPHTHAANVLWAKDFQIDSTIDGTAIKNQVRGHLPLGDQPPSAVIVIIGFLP